MTRLHFPDPEGLADLVTLVTRARSAAPDGAIRLQTRGTQLRVWAEILSGSGLFAEGAAIGVRGWELAEAPPVPAGQDGLDVVVTSAALADRFARAEPGERVLPVPPTTVHAPWAGATGALRDWAPVGLLPAGDLVEAAETGIADVAAGVAEAGGSAGALAVQTLRARVWGRGMGGGVPAGAAFAAYVLGFVRRDDQPAEVYRSGRWVRLGTRGGHVLAR